MESEGIRYSDQLTNYCQIFKKFVDHGQQICLGGALETDFKTLRKRCKRKHAYLFLPCIDGWKIFYPRAGRKVNLNSLASPRITPS